jgi:uncharacterized surface protein with fasciclin (FAS1) repeats
MAIFNRSSFALVLSALISSSVYGQSSINFQPCGATTDLRTDAQNGDFSNNQSGSQRRTYGNLCSGTQDTGSTANDIDITSRVGHPFRRFCDIIDRYPNVAALMSTGTSPHTVFAPTDAAFAKIDGLISRVDEQKLLELHILPQSRLTRDLRCGQTYRTINTQQDRRSNQRSKTRCISAARSQQLGPGNVVNGLKPTIGVPGNTFNAEQFGSQNNFVLTENPNAEANAKETFSQDVISCNGVIHVVDEVLLPGGQNAFANQGNYNSYGVQGNNGGGYYGSQNNYYGGTSHSHGQGSYYGSSYGSSHNRGNYYTKKGKGAKAGKAGARGNGYYGGAPPRRPYNGGYYGGYNSGFLRKLEGGNTADADELFMTDAEFFGTDGLIENDTKAEDSENRKRRLEALLEPDGNIAQA